MKQADVRHAYDSVPQGFHDALHRAVHDVQEEKPMKKTGIRILICALMLALACGTALAIVQHYSVRQYQTGGAPSAAFEKNITQVDHRFENDYITFTLTDAVFDGDAIALAMDILPKDPLRPVYLYPTLTALCDGRPLDLDIQGMRGDFSSGFLLPMQAGEDGHEGHFGFDAGLYEDEAAGDVTWTFTMQVLVPCWPVRNEESALVGAETREEFDAHMQRFREAYDGQEILVTGGDSLVEYAAMLPVPEGMTEEAARALRLGDALVASGAFTLADTLVCTFDTGLPEERWRGVGAGLVFPLADYTVAFLGMDVSFMRVSYAFDLLFPPEVTREALEALAADGLDYTLRDQNGQALAAGGHSGKQALTREDGRLVLRCEGAADFSQDIPTEIHFVPGVLTAQGWVPEEANQFVVPVAVP